MSRIIEFVKKPAVLMGTALAITGTSGFVVATVALGQEPAPPTKTVTVNVATGQQGEPGPAGPVGPPGPAGPAGLDCLAGYSPGILVLIQQGKGPTRVYTCLED